MSVPRRILLNPGPCTTSEHVKRALVMPDLCPREQEFGALLVAVRAALPRVVHGEATHTCVLLSGPGTAAMESCLTAVVGPGDRALIVDNGAYGRRAEQIALTYGIPHLALRVGWTLRAEPETIEAALRDHAGLTHCYFVHHETTTGMLNPLEEIIDVCGRRGIVTIVDAMSSMGGVPLDLRSSRADFVISSANKCLQGFPGIAFVIAERSALARTADLPRRSFTLNLHDNWRSQEEGGEFLYTPPVQVLSALQAALDELFAEGVESRHRRYTACYDTLHAGMRALGFAALLPEAWHSRLLTTYREPDHPAWSFEAMHDDLYRQGITVYPGKLTDVRTFRLANIGDLVPADLDRFLAGLRDHLVSRGLAR